MPDLPDWGHENLTLVARSALVLAGTCLVGAVVAWVVGDDGPRGHTTVDAVLVLSTVAVGLVAVAFLVGMEAEQRRRHQPPPREQDWYAD